MKRKFFPFILYFTLAILPLKSDLPDIDPPRVTDKLEEIMKAHVSYKKMTPELVRRALVNYLEELDPAKTYFVTEDIQRWLEPSDDYVEKILENYKNSDFSAFEEIHDSMVAAIHRRRHLNERIDSMTLPEKVSSKEFKDLTWVEDEDALIDRLLKLKALQTEATEKLDDPDLKEKGLQRIEKRRHSYEEDFLVTDEKERQQFLLSNVLKATAGALDTHTAYFTPGEATQFMISVQQRLFGIGAQLRDDLNGFTVVKIVEGGPAFDGGQLKAKDKIIAVNGEPVVGMDIQDAVELIRGDENTPVVLQVIRDIPTDNESTEEQKLDVTVMRGEVVLKETRFETSIEPFADGVIAYQRLFSFYQDPESSSAADLAKELQKLKEEHNVKGIVLDLRSNSGGLLTQAVAVTGLFMTKGIVCTIKDDKGNMQHLRDLDNNTVWEGPLVVLTNRGSASAAEIVAQTLQDYGRAIIVGDDATFGKGSFQTFTLTTRQGDHVDPEGEYKVTRGRYYTVSGKSPQLTGVISDIVVPGVLSAFDVGERFAKFPLETDTISPNFDDTLSDVPWSQRDKIRKLYKFNLQKQLDTYSAHIDRLKENSSLRIENNKNYQVFLKELENKDDDDDPDSYGQNDLQLTEAYNIMKDLIVLMDKTTTE